MKILNTVQYQYQILRYRHHATTGELANIGLVYFDPQTRFLRVRFIKSCKRLNDFFGEISEEFLLKTLETLEKEFNRWAESLKTDASFNKYKEVEKITSAILPIDDNALQFSDTFRGFEFDHRYSFSYIYNLQIGKNNNDLIEIENENKEERKKAIEWFLAQS